MNAAEQNQQKLNDMAAFVALVAELVRPGNPTVERVAASVNEALTIAREGKK